MKKIRIVSPAKHIDKISIDFAKEFLIKKGFKVEISPNALGRNNYFSGTVQERLTDFQDALDDPTVYIILCSRGGYGSVQLIDELDFSTFIKQPKLIIGYSDITVFHNHIFTHFGINTVHATAPLNFSENTIEALNSLLNILNEKPNKYQIPVHQLNNYGEITAPIIGGNLAIIYSLLGTNSDADYTDKILFIEEVGEAVYSIDRMFYALKKAGKLAQIKGLIIGGLTQVKDSEIPYGLTAEQVIKKQMESFKIPICFNFPAGHINDNRAIIIGKNATLSVNKKQVVFEQ